MANGSNTIDLEEIKRRTQQLGEEDARGKDTQFKFHLQTLEGSYHAVLSNDKNKHGDKVDDATLLSQIYFKARSAQSMWDAKSANNRKLISTARLDIRAGACTDWGQGEPLNTVHKLTSIWQNLRKAPTNQGKLEDATNVLHRYLRMQLKRPDLLEDAELRQICFKRVKDPRSLEQFWQDTEETFRKLKVGSLASSTLQDNHSLVDLIRDACKDRREALRVEAELVALAEEEADEESQRLSDEQDANAFK